MRGFLFFLVWLGVSALTVYVTYEEVQHLLSEGSRSLAYLTTSAAIVGLMTLAYVLFTKWRDPDE